MYTFIKAACYGTAVQKKSELRPRVFGLCRIVFVALGQAQDRGCVLKAETWG